MKGNNDIHQGLSMGEMLTVKFRQPSHEWHNFCILSIGTNPLGITSSFVHVGFGV
jgi:hypothetical protein